MRRTFVFHNGCYTTSYSSNDQPWKIEITHAFIPGSFEPTNKQINFSDALLDFFEFDSRANTSMDILVVAIRVTHFTSASSHTNTSSTRSGERVIGQLKQP